MSQKRGGVKTVQSVHFYPLEGLEECTPRTDLSRWICAQMPLQNGDVLVVSSKVISKIEGRIVEGKTVIPSPFAHTLSARTGHNPVYCEIVLGESADIVRMAPGVVLCRTHHGFVIANAGVDASNAGGVDRYILLPEDPDGSAQRLHDACKAHTGVNVAVIISDTFGRAWRLGQTDLAIGVAGLSPLRDYAGEMDRDGHRLEWSALAHADELASGAELVRGKANGIGVVLVRGYCPTGHGSATDQVMPSERDLFR